MITPELTPLSQRIIGLFPELLGVGGVQEAGRMTAAALQESAFRHNWSTDFLSLNDPQGAHSIEAAERTISLSGFGRRKIHFLLSGVSKARLVARNSESIVLAAHPNLAVVSSWMQRVCPRLQTVVMAHGVEVWKPLASLRRRALLRANVVLAPSRDTAQKLIEVQGVPPERIRRLPWPLNPRFLRLAEASANLPLPSGFPGRGRVILTVGRWAASERYKGADELIRSVSQLVTIVPGLHLVAVGAGDDLSRLERLAANLKVADRVHFLENLSCEEIAACYANAELFALPSAGEGFGLVFLEAMAFSKPVVGASCGGTTDIVEDGINGLLVPPGDAGALAQALGRLLGDEPLRAGLGQRGAEIVRRKFQFAVFQSELEKILGECTSSLG
jgi:glycosyltransferase involved in cell wall biosynthesis